MKEKIKKYYLYFMMYAIIGWIYEVFLEVFIYKWGFSNRGVLFGPYCPVYGFGALAFIFTIGKLLNNKNFKQKIFLIPIVFIGCMVVATIIELFTSYICEFILGSWPWQTYINYKYNFEARIALNPSLRFGLGGIIFLYLLQPIFEIFINSLSVKKLNFLFYGISTMFILDILFRIIYLFF